MGARRRRYEIIASVGAAAALVAGVVSCSTLFGIHGGVAEAGESGAPPVDGATSGDGEPPVDAPPPVDGSPDGGADGPSPDAEAGPPTAGPVEVFAGGDEEEANNHHACARYVDGRVFCWGLNTWGQLGIDPSAAATSATPVQVGGLTKAKKITGGSGHSCALRTDEAVVCWGHNAQGELGVPVDAGIALPTPQLVPLPGPVADISGGDVYTCAAMKSGDLYCWGSNVGRFGTGAQGTSQNGPTKIASSYLLTAVTLGPYAAGAIDSAARAICWGQGNNGGILGRNTTSANGSYYTPAPTVGFGLVTRLRANVVGFCGFASPASATDGVYCWGGNTNGQLGSGAAAGTQVLTPTLVPEFTRAAGVVAFGSGYYNTCAVFQSGAVQCIGATSFGVVGGGGTPGISTTPAAVANLTDAVDVSVGPSFACALRKGGGPAGGPSVACWGANQSGQLGNGSTAPSPGAVNVLLPPP